MTIECYYGDCQYHAPDDDGPFCYENHCKASDKELVVFERKRREGLLKHVQALEVLAHWGRYDDDET